MAVDEEDSDSSTTTVLWPSASYKPAAQDSSRLPSPSTTPSPSTSGEQASGSIGSGNGDVNMALRCCLCTGNPLPSLNSQLVQVSPVISVHTFCLARVKKMLDCGNREVGPNELELVVKKFRSVACHFCKKKGAAIGCSVAGCKASIHMSCFFLNFKEARKEKATTLAYCNSHLWKAKVGGSPASKPARAEVAPPPRSQQPSAKRFKKLCQAPACVCPQGPNYFNSSLWPLRFCKSCSSTSAHAKCINMRKRWICSTCEPTEIGSTDSQCTDNRPGEAESVPANVFNKDEASPGLLGSKVLPSMKWSFNKVLDSHFGRGKKRKAERSPLGPRQKETVEAEAGSEAEEETPGDSPSARNGKENGGGKGKSPAKRKVQPRDKWIVSTASQPNPSKPRAATPKKGKEEVKTATGPESESLKQSPRSEPSSPAKKFVEVNDGSKWSASEAMTAASKSRAKLRLFAETAKGECVQQSVKKVSVELKDLNDRQLFHIRTSLPIEPPQPEAEEDYQWLTDMSCRQIDEFLDLNEGEKAFFKLWNTHLFQDACYGDRMLIQVLEHFVDAYSGEIWRQRLYRNFVLHLVSLLEFNAISQATLSSLVCRLQDSFAAQDGAKPRLDLASASRWSTSRSSTPRIDDGMSQSSDSSLRLYLSESESESEHEVRELRRKLSPAFRSHACGRRQQQLEQQQLAAAGRGKSVRFVYDGSTHLLSDLPALATGSASAKIDYGRCATVRYIRSERKARGRERITRRDRHDRRAAAAEEKPYASRRLSCRSQCS